ncbi:MAG: cytochrome c biogenesis CcdA family protein [Bacillota bacterium]
MESSGFLMQLFLAFGAGVLSFLTPCCLPIYPSFLSYVTGVSMDEISAGTRAARSRVLKHSLAFFVGFSTIYVSLGLTASALGSFFYTSRDWLPVVGGIFVSLMGLALLGVIRIPFLMRDSRIQLANRPEGYLGSVVIGLTFAAGWTPCIGPILGAVLALAANSPGMGGILLLAYSVGFAIPFVGLAYALGSVRVLSRYSIWVERVGGAMMVLMGILLATGYMERMSAWLIEVTGFQGF